MTSIAAVTTRTLTLRSLLLLLVLALTLYALGIAVYLSYTVTSRASSLGHAVQPLEYLFGVLTDRVQGLQSAAEQSWKLVLAGKPVSPPVTADLRNKILVHEGNALAAPFAGLPADLRAELTTADEQVAQLGSMLLEVTGLIEVGQFPAAKARSNRVDSLMAEVENRLTEARRDALPVLIASQRDLSATTTRAIRAVTIWLVIGILMAPAVLWLSLRYLARPIARLERGLAQVAEGDLQVELPVDRDDEIGQLTRHFNETTRVLRERAEEQGRFMAAGQLIAGVAHEVNNPLMAIVALAESRLEIAQLPDDQRLELLQIARQARRAGKLLSGLLRFVRTDDLPRAAGDINGVAREAIDLVSYQFGVGEITLVSKLEDTLPAARGDPGRLEQVLVNLLSNAIHALGAVAPPRNLVVESWYEGGSIHVAVEDNGPGVAPDLVNRLFRPFVSTKGRRGTGLGLYLSRQIARDAGGDLILGDSAGPGARFVLSLPVAQLDAQAAADSGDHLVPEARVSPLSGMRVLLVDDEEALRRPLARFLTLRGADVAEAGNGEEALAALEQREADVILTDLRMPRMDGMEMYATLEAARPDLARRVIFLSGDLSQLATAGWIQMPRNRILLKPVELSALELRLEEVARSLGFGETSED